MLPPRVMTGALYLAGWVVLAWVGGWPLTIAVAFAAVLSMQELKWVASHRRMRLANEAGYPLAVAFILAAHWFANDLENFGLATLVLLVLLVLVDFLLHMRQGMRAPTACVSLTVFAVVYCGLMASCIVLLRGYQPHLVDRTPWFGLMPFGQRLLFFCLAVTMLSDTAAYVVGKLFGRTKLSETVSPQKTVEGCLGAVVAAVLASLIFGAIFQVGVTPTAELLPAVAVRHSIGHRVVLGLLIGIVGQVGDFGASIFKREAEVKDYSSLFPGHGGMLDRIDTLLVTAPLVYLYVQCAL